MHTDVHADASPGARNRGAAVRDGVGAVVAPILGLAPHVLHHIGLLAGAAVVTGATGNVVFYVLGLALSVPMLRRLHRHWRTPWAPAIAVVAFTALFSLSAFVVGPAISGGSDAPQPTSPVEPSPGPTDEHGH